jgi:hypothetical protein
MLAILWPFVVAVVPKGTGGPASVFMKICLLLSHWNMSMRVPFYSTVGDNLYDHHCYSESESSQSLPCMRQLEGVTEAQDRWRMVLGIVSYICVV